MRTWLTVSNALHEVIKQLAEVEENTVGINHAWFVTVLLFLKCTYD